MVSTTQLGLMLLGPTGPMDQDGISASQFLQGKPLNHGLSQVAELGEACLDCKWETHEGVCILKNNWSKPQVESRSHAPCVPDIAEAQYMPCPGIVASLPQALGFEAWAVQQHMLASLCCSAPFGAQHASFCDASLPGAELGNFVFTQPSLQTLKIKLFCLPAAAWGLSFPRLPVSPHDQLPASAPDSLRPTQLSPSASSVFFCKSKKSHKLPLNLKLEVPISQVPDT